MSREDTTVPMLSRTPTVARPGSHAPLRRKLNWTTGILVLYSFLTNVTLFGVGTGSQGTFGQSRSIPGGGQGVVLQLGVGPVVIASIVFQLLQGRGLFSLSMGDPGDQTFYQGLQRPLVLGMIVLQGLSIVFAGGYLLTDPVVTSTLGVGTVDMKWLIFTQISTGGVLVLFMDEIISKWGVGSGVSLFIIASVSQRLVGSFSVGPAIGASTTDIVSE